MMLWLKNSDVTLKKGSGERLQTAATLLAIIFKGFYSLYIKLTPDESFKVYCNFYFVAFLQFKFCRGLIVQSAGKCIIPLIRKCFTNLAVPS